MAKSKVTFSINAGEELCTLKLNEVPMVDDIVSLDNPNVILRVKARLYRHRDGGSWDLRCTKY